MMEKVEQIKFNSCNKFILRYCILLSLLFLFSLARAQHLGFVDFYDEVYQNSDDLEKTTQALSLRGFEYWYVEELEKEDWVSFKKEGGNTTVEISICYSKENGKYKYSYAVMQSLDKKGADEYIKFMTEHEDIHPLETKIENEILKRRFIDPSRRTVFELQTIQNNGVAVYFISFEPMNYIDFLLAKEKAIIKN